MKALLILFSLVIFNSCQPKPIEEKPTKILPVIDEAKQIFAEKPYGNPVFMAGTNSDFLGFFASLKQNAGIESLLPFVSQQSKIHFTNQQILNLLYNANFQFKKKLKSVRLKNNIQILTYLGEINATTCLKTLSVTTSDTCKIILPNNLDDFLR